MHRRFLFTQWVGVNMAEGSTEPVGLWLGIQAGAFLGLYFGFSLALVSALTSPEELLRIVYLITFFPMVGGILLGPFLARRERPVVSGTPPIQRTMEALEGMDEGQGKWRVLSHVRSDGRTVRIDLHDSSRVQEILNATTPLAEEFPVRYMVGRGVSGSREPDLRANVLSILDNQFPKTRQSRYTSAIEISPELPERLRDQRKRINMLLAVFLPIATFLGWLEMR
ncbi:MAG: hypothetical protein CMA18_004695 [Methanobacteriota archaeon]|nr:MAG: hypothetical protein CBC63_06500 [Euryarchaeota archaeon TMED103]RAH10920.1 MAG: hypothetical protein CMA18_004695 [Euryarchaeota archaeon]